MCEVKRCTACGIEQPLTEYHKASKGRFGRSAKCKTCRSEQARAAYVSGGTAERLALHYQKNRAKRIRQVRANYAQNRNAILEKKRAYRIANRERINESARIKRAADPDSYRLRDAARYARTRNRVREQVRAYRLRNRGRVTAWLVKRKVAKKYRTPPWLSASDRQAIVDCYEVAATWRLLFAVDVHVDHIIPLQADSVSGLHVPWNLRIVRAEMNMRKGTRWCEEDSLAPSRTWEDAAYSAA